MSTTDELRMLEARELLRIAELLLMMDKNHQEMKIEDIPYYSEIYDRNLKALNIIAGNIAIREQFRKKYAAHA